MACLSLQELAEPGRLLPDACRAGSIVVRLTIAVNDDEATRMRKLPDDFKTKTSDIAL